MTPSELVLRFVDTEEYKFNTLQPNTQGATTNLSGLINTYYNRLFDRDAVQAEINGWVNELNTGGVNVDYLGITIANAGLNLTGSDLANTLNNKIAQANAFADALAADTTLNQKYTGWLAIDAGIQFNNSIGENTTTAEAATARAAAFARLPEAGVLIEVSESATSVAEGDSVAIGVEGFGPDAAGQKLDYVIVGNDGFGVNDVVGGELTGQITLDSNGNGLIQVSVKGADEGELDPADPGESFTVIVSGSLGTGVSSKTITVIDGPAPVPTLSVAPSSPAVDEGATLTFNITSTEIAAGTEVAYILSGVTSADVNNAPLTGTVAISGDVTDGEGKASVSFLVSEDLSFEGSETVVFAATVVGVAAASTSVVINDTSTPAVQAVLTTDTDVVVNTAAAAFEIVANEATLGQNDQITSQLDNAVLNIGTDGSFDIANFSTNNVDTFDFTTSASAGRDGTIDMRNAVSVENLNISRSNLDSFQFEDLQSAVNLKATIDDSFTDYYFNFDSTALTGTDSFDVVFSEAPIDAVGGNSLGIAVTQGPGVRTAASVEVLNLSSVGSSASNILGVLSVGSELETLSITGSVDLNITQDIGDVAGQTSDLGQVAGNTLITTINASTLNADLFGGVGGALAYTSRVTGEVDVLGAIGDNTITLTSDLFGAATTEFDVLTQEGNDAITTSIGDDTVTTAGGNDSVISGIGDDLIAAGNGNNLVQALGGNNTVTSLEGADTIVTSDGTGTIVGADSVDSGLGNDVVFTGLGNDTVVSMGGNNQITTSEFNFTTAFGDISGNSNDSVVTGGGNDTINLGGGGDTVRSGDGNDVVQDGNQTSSTILTDGDANLIQLEAGNDVLTLHLDNLQSNDTVDGGSGFDLINLTEGGFLRQSETRNVSNIEAFNLLDGDTTSYDITLSNDLVASSDDVRGGQRVFSIFTQASTKGTADDTAGDVTLDLTNIELKSGGLDNSIRYSGQATNAAERLVVNDLIMDQFLHAEFAERVLLDEGIADVIAVQDTAEITNSDLQNVSGLEAFDLIATTNGDVDFVFDFSSMSTADFNRLVGGIADTLLIRATESLNVASASNLLLTLAPDADFGDRIIIEESAELNVTVVGGATAPTIRTALFFTPNPDDLFPVDGQTVVAFELSDVQTADRVEGDVDVVPLIVGGQPTFASSEKIDFRFGLSNENRSMQEQLNNVSTEDVDVFDFNPGAVDQAVEFNTLYGGRAAIIAANVLGAPANSITGLNSILTSGGNDSMLNIEAAANNAAGTLTATSLYIESAAGNDTITAEGAQLTGDTGNDASLTVFAGTGNDSVDGFNGSNADDFLFGEAGNDTIRGLEGDDSLGGGTGADSLLGGGGADTIGGGTGADTILGEGGADVIDGGADNDSILGGAANDSIDGGIGDDFINAGAANDTVTGGAGADSILSGTGSDSIEGGVGDDLIGFGDDFINETSNNITNFFVTNASPVFVDEASQLTDADDVSGGTAAGVDTGVDTVSIAMGDGTTAQTLELTSVFFRDVEQLNVVADGLNNSLTIDNSVLGSSDSITVITTDLDDDDGELDFDSSSFVQGESVVFYDSDLTVGTNLRNFGAGNDQYANDYLDPTFFATIAGNGGADTIALSDNTGDFTADLREVVRYNTGNDGSLVPGANTGGDLILNFKSVESGATANADKVMIAASTGVDESGAASNQATGLLFDLTQDKNADATLYGSLNKQLVLGGQNAAAIPGAILGHNMLFLTGPAKSLQDSQLTDAVAIANAINNVGVVGNGLNTGSVDASGNSLNVDQQSNQALIVQQGQTDTALWLYVERAFDFDEAEAYTAEAGDLTQLAIFENTLLANGDFITDLGTAVEMVSF